MEDDAESRQQPNMGEYMDDYSSERRSQDLGGLDQCALNDAYFEEHCSDSLLGLALGGIQHGERRRSSRRVIWFPSR